MATKALDDAKYFCLRKVFRLWRAIAEGFRVDYVTGTYRFEESRVREALQVKQGKAMEMVKYLDG